MAHLHLKLAHLLWKEQIQPGDCVIDATLGRGKDALYLASILFPSKESLLITLDIQQEAILSAKERLKDYQSFFDSGIFFFNQSHEAFPPLCQEKKPKLIIYNLGYLPGSDKSCTTLAQSTLKSLESALSLLLPGGMISITCYIGHPEGALETSAVEAWIDQKTSPFLEISRHSLINRPLSPILYVIKKY